jgi:hypothetical protein
MKIHCPGCRYHFEVGSDLIGQHMHCPKCNHRLLVHEEHPAPFAPGRLAHPLLRLLFFVIFLAVIGSLAAAIIYFAAAVFRKGV